MQARRCYDAAPVEPWLAAAGHELDDGDTVDGGRGQGGRLLRRKAQ